MNGHNVLWPMAWHITGTPILAISSCIERRESATIALYKNYVRLYEDDESRVEQIVNSFVDPWNIANYFAEKITPGFQEDGLLNRLVRGFRWRPCLQPVYSLAVRQELMELGLIVHRQHPSSLLHDGSKRRRGRRYRRRRR